MFSQLFFFFRFSWMAFMRTTKQARTRLFCIFDPSFCLAECKNAKKFLTFQFKYFAIRMVLCFTSPNLFKSYVSHCNRSKNFLIFIFLHFLKLKWAKSCKLSVTLVLDRFRDVQLHDGRVQEDSEAISRNSATLADFSYQLLISELYLNYILPRYLNGSRQWTQNRLK